MTKDDNQSTPQLLNLATEDGRISYEAALSRFDRRLPYYELGYFDAFAGGAENLYCIVWRHEGLVFLMPGYASPIPGASEYRDFTTPYGYTGPICSGNGTAHWPDFWKSVHDLLNQEYIVTEFIRFALDETPLHYPGTTVRSLSNVKGQILEYDDQWRGFEHKVRKNVNRAKREGLQCTIYLGRDISKENLDQFNFIYRATMERANAAERFMFDPLLIERFVALHPECTALALVTDNGQTVSTELVLVDDVSIYSFLGGTLEHAFAKRPNDLLKYELINWARSHNKLHFILGGGSGSDDGIFKYKRSFFPNDSVPWLTGRRIFDTAKYIQLCGESTHADSEDAAALSEAAFFPAYRTA